MLPRLGAVLGHAQRDPSEPHAAAAHPRGLSLAMSAYYWADFCLGGLIRLLPVRLRAGIVVQQRGWWDMSVDPTRYRLDVADWIIRLLGAFTPRVDVAFILEASPDALLARKAELPWIRTSAANRGVAAGPPAEDATDLSGRIPSRRGGPPTGDGEDHRVHGGPNHRSPWCGLGDPAPVPPRPLVDLRGLAATARTALAVHPPMKPEGRVLWKGMNLLAEAGGFRLLPRGSAPPRALREKVAPYLPPRTTIAVARSNHPGRYTAFFVDEQGRRRGLAKVATDKDGALSLEREAVAIRTFGSALKPPLLAPGILEEKEGLLLFEAVPWVPRRRP